LRNNSAITGLTACVILLFGIGIVLQQKNKQLSEAKNKLLLQNDSVLAVNQQLQKQITCLKHHIDSLHNVPEKQTLTSR
jgi:hypothetical protein